MASSNGSGGGISIGKGVQCAVIDVRANITYTWKKTIPAKVSSSGGGHSMVNICSIQQHAATASEAVTALETAQGAVTATATANLETYSNNQQA